MKTQRTRTRQQALEEHRTLHGLCVLQRHNLATDAQVARYVELTRQLYGGNARAVAEQAEWDAIGSRFQQQRRNK